MTVSVHVVYIDSVPRNFLNNRERTLLRAVSSVAYSNPFLPKWAENQRKILGPNYEKAQPLGSIRIEDSGKISENSRRIQQRVLPLLETLRNRLVKGIRGHDRDLIFYEDVVLYVLYYRYLAPMSKATFTPPERKASKDRWAFYDEFLCDWDHYLKIPGVTLPTAHQARHAFAIFIQFRRAFRYIFTHIIGSSLSSVRLRAAVWESIFTHDVRHYQRMLYRRMGDFATLVTGPSGSGKELVAQAIAKSRYVPFDDKKLAFQDPSEDAFCAINLPALSPTLIESELFGHRRGAFTGAVRDRRGWLEICPPSGTVFLDEIGDLDPLLQVKLLRVIETRTFQAVGDEANRQFQGKIVAATNRDLSVAIEEGRFREDLYFRLCSDRIAMPSFHEVLQESPEVLPELTLFMAKRVLRGEGDDDDASPSEVKALSEEVEGWIRKELGLDYPWPGNYRELEQCVRNILIHKEYRPLTLRREPSKQTFLNEVTAGRLTAEQLLCWYCTVVYWKTESYAETARRLKLDRRTVKSKINPQVLDQLRRER